jgi:hypothetical protein
MSRLVIAFGLFFLLILLLVIVGNMTTGVHAEYGGDTAHEPSHVVVQAIPIDGSSILAKAGRLGSLAQIGASLLVGRTAHEPSHTQFDPLINGYDLTFEGVTEPYTNSPMITLEVTTTTGTSNTLLARTDFEQHYVPGDQSATITSLDNAVRMFVPAGALLPDSYVIINSTVQLPGDPPMGFRQLSSAYSIRASGAVSQSLSPMLLEMDFDPGMLAGRNRYTVSMFWWDELQNQWQDVESEPSGTMPTQSRSLRRFGIYVLMAGTTWRDTLQNYEALGNRQNVRVTHGRLELSSAQTSGYAESSVIMPDTPFSNWGEVHYVAEAGNGTTLTIDVLAADRTVLLSNVPDGASLAGLDPVAHPGLLLRVNLTSQQADISPALDSWSVSWHALTPSTQRFFLPWIRKAAISISLVSADRMQPRAVSSPRNRGVPSPEATMDLVAEPLDQPRLEAPDAYGCEPPPNPPVTWTTPVRLTVSTTIAIAPEVAVDRQGRLHAVWYDDSRTVFYASKASGAGAWSTPTAIPGSTNAYYPNLEVDVQGVLHVIWRGNDDIVYTTRSASGNWSSPTNLSNTGRANILPQMHLDTGGNLHVVWSDSSPGNAEIFYVRKSAGGTWSGVERVSSTANTSWAPDVVADSQGNVHVVWYEDGEIFYTWRSVNGGWSAAANISHTAGSSLWPALAVGADDTVHLVWVDRLPTGINGDVFILFYASKPVGGSWTSGLELTRVPGSGQNLMAPSLAVGPTGSLHVAWATVTEWALRYLTRLDPETGWSTPQVVATLIPSPTPGNQWYFLGLAVAPDRGVHLLWNDMVSPSGFKQDIMYSSALPPPIPANHVAVVDGSGRAVRGACVYQNGRLVGVSDALGIVAPGSLRLGDRLVAMKPLDEQSFHRADWAYRTSLTSLTIDRTNPNTPVSGYKVTQLGRQALQLNPTLPLVTFNLVISLQWNATPSYMQEISQAMKLASDYLFDVSDGQMALGRVTIYDNGEHWREADIQILARQFVRPYGYVGGLRSANASDIMRVGRQWDRWGGQGRDGTGHGYWNLSDGYRTLIHEFGHYGLNLFDSYFGYVFQNGQIVRVEDSVGCTENAPDPIHDAVNASLMNWQYESSELSARGVPQLWSSECEQTAQWQLNEESDWETVLERFADTTIPARWQLTRPITGGMVITGPMELSANLLNFPETEVKEDGDAAPIRQLTVHTLAGQPYTGGAQVAVDTVRAGQTVAIYQGQTNAQGQIEVYGAAAGDTLRATTLSGSVSAQTMVGIQTSYVIILGVTVEQQTNDPPINAWLSMIPSPEGDDLTVMVGGVSANSTMRVVIAPPGTAIPASILLQPQSSGIYSATAHFPVAGKGLGGLNLRGSTAEAGLISQDADFNLVPVNVVAEQDLCVPDGVACLHLEPNSFAQTNVSMVLMPSGAIPQPLPAGLTAVGQAYSLRASGGVTGTARPAVLRLFYDPARLGPGVTPANLQIAFWNGTNWQVRPSKLDPEHLTISAVINELGIYALLEPSSWGGSPRIYLPQIRK